MAVIMVTHDLGVVAGMADHVAVMYAGKVVEYAERRRLYYTPAHPYTRGLLASLPTRSRGQARLAQIAGQPPSLISLAVRLQFLPPLPGSDGALPSRRTARSWTSPGRRASRGRRAGWRVADLAGPSSSGGPEQPQRPARMRAPAGTPALDSPSSGSTAS